MKTKLKDVIVLLPGIMGSALADKNGKSVWDVNIGALCRAFHTLGGSLKDLALRSDESQGDGVTATHLIPDVHMIPHFWKIDGYSGITEYLDSKYELVTGENYFEFPYDWRLDNRIAARRLNSAAQEWLERRRSLYPDARLVLLAHSMGGLVARH